MGEFRILTVDEIARRIAGVQIVCLILTFLTGLGIVFKLFGVIEGPSQGEALLAVLPVWACFLVYYGLEKKKEWVLPLALAFSTFISLMNLFHVLAPAPDLATLVEKPFAGGFVLFSAYQIRLFQKEEVRHFLGAKGKIVISMGGEQWAISH